jgi:hypothetical protein
MNANPNVDLDRVAKRAAKPCGFTAEELDFIVNHDTRLRRSFGGRVKYRLGRSMGEEEE